MLLGDSVVKKNIAGYVDTDGEFHEGEGIPVWVGRKTAFTRLYGRSWMVIAQEAFAYMAMDKDLTLEPKNVLMYLFGRLDFENFIQIPQVEIANDLGMKKQSVLRAIKLLEKKEIIMRGPKVGRSSCWRLNPRYGYKGNPNGKVDRDSKNGNLRLIK